MRSVAGRRVPIVLIVFFVLVGIAVSVAIGRIIAAGVDEASGNAVERQSLLQESSAFVGRQRPTEVVPLRLGAAVSLQEFELLPRFHAFGDDPHVQTPSPADDRVDDTRIVRVDPDAPDEGLIDLQRVDREGSEEAQAGIAGTEIIERQLYADFLQCPKH